MTKEAVLTLTFVFVHSLLIGDTSVADDAQAAKDAAIIETLLRLQNIDVNGNEKLKAAVTRYLATKRGTLRYVELVEHFKLRDAGDELIRLAVADPTSTLGVRSVGLLLKLENKELLKKSIDSKDEKSPVAVVTALGLVANKPAIDLLMPIVTDMKYPSEVRVTAARGLVRNRSGERFLLDLVTSKRLPKDLTFVAGDILHASADAAIRKEIAKHIQLPATAAGEPLPPVAQLVKLQGNFSHGQKIFSTTGTCASCHIVHKQGKEVGPNLSEIGSKLSREAMYVSILDPSAGISHNYETYSIVTLDGVVVTGIKISETDDSITLKTAKAIVQKIAKDDIDEMQKQKISLMPANLQKLMKVQDLVDVVEYLTTLKKAQ